MNQPTNTSLYGNVGVIVDLFAYRSDILAVIDQPDCDDGLDDDGDGLVDYPADPGCTSPTDTSEREATLACDNELDASYRLFLGSALRVNAVSTCAASA